MRTSRLRRCAADRPLILYGDPVLRLRRSVARGAPAARAVAGATPQSEGLVRVRDEVEIHTSPLPSWGRSRTNNPWREGHPNAAVERGGSTDPPPACRRCPNCSRFSCHRPPAWSLDPVSRWPCPRHCDPRLPYAATPHRVSLPDHGEHRHFEAADETLADRSAVDGSKQGKQHPGQREHRSRPPLDAPAAVLVPVDAYLARHVRNAPAETPVDMMDVKAPSITQPTGPVTTPAIPSPTAAADVRNPSPDFQQPMTTSLVE